jgi:hypothetical protein
MASFTIETEVIPIHQTGNDNDLVCCGKKRISTPTWVTSQKAATATINIPIKQSKSNAGEYRRQKYGTH